MQNNITYPPATGGGGDPTLLAEHEVTGSAVTSIDFSGLNIDVHESYYFEVEFVNAIGSVCEMFIFVNNDTVNANYYNQYMSSSGTGVSGAKLNYPRLGFAEASKRALIHGHVSAVDGYFFYTSFCGSANDTSVRHYQQCGGKIASVGNITQLTFTATTANGLAVGSKIRIYRGDV